MKHQDLKFTCFCLILFLIGQSQSHFVTTHDFSQSNMQKGENITQQMVTKITQSIKQTAANCSSSDRSCFSQIIGMKIQKLYGKSWNVHLFQKSTSIIKAKQYSHERWITLYNEGDPAFSYYIFKPNDCSKPFILKQEILSSNSQPQQYWGSSMTQALKLRVRAAIQDAYSNSQAMDKNTEYIQSTMGLGKWQVIIWNTPSFDYLNTCMYANYFGLIVGIQRGNSIWSYYIGRMSLI